MLTQSCRQVESVIFPPTTGGAKALAEEFNIPLLGSLPVDPRIARACDQGTNIITEEPTLTACQNYISIANSNFLLLWCILYLKIFLYRNFSLFYQSRALRTYDCGMKLRLPNINLLKIIKIYYLF